MGVELSLFLMTYVLGLLFGNQCFHVFDSNRKDEKSTVSAAGTVGRSVKIWIFLTTTNYIVLVIMLIIQWLFEIQFIRISFDLYGRNRILDSIKNRRKNSAVKREYHDNPEPQKKYSKRKYNKENSESKKISGKEKPREKKF